MNNKRTGITSLLYLIVKLNHDNYLRKKFHLDLHKLKYLTSTDLFTCTYVSQRLPLDNPWSVFRLLCPDLGVCVVALVTVILCNRLVRNREMVAAANITSVSLCV